MSVSGSTFEDGVKIFKGQELNGPTSSETTDSVVRIKAAVGEPYYQRDGFLLYNMDCLKGLKKIRDSSVNLTVTSPPYNIGKEYEKVMPLARYIGWCQSWFDEVYRITKPDGAFLLNIGYAPVSGKGHAVPLAYLLWDKTRFYLLQEIVWNYGAGVAGRRILSPRNEKVLWFVKDKERYTFNLDDIRDQNVKYPNQKKNGKIRVNTLGKNPSDVWQIAKVTSGTGRSPPERTPHPAQFPVDLIERIVKGFSNRGDLILDPFMGSGTVAEVALKHERAVVGFEIQRKYCEYITNRIEKWLPTKYAPLEKFTHDTIR